VVLPHNLQLMTSDNAHAERFVRTIKESCLERIILFGEGTLRKVIHEFVEHYHFELNHQGLGNRLIIEERSGYREQWTDSVPPAAGRNAELLLSSGSVRKEQANSEGEIINRCIHPLPSAVCGPFLGGLQPSVPRPQACGPGGR
jgi:hypothetical protein